MTTNDFHGINSVGLKPFGEQSKNVDHLLWVRWNAPYSSLVCQWIDHFSKIGDLVCWRVWRAAYISEGPWQTTPFKWDQCGTVIRSRWESSTGVITCPPTRHVYPSVSSLTQCFSYHCFSFKFLLCFFLVVLASLYSFCPLNFINNNLFKIW